MRAPTSLSSDSDWSVWELPWRRNRNAGRPVDSSDWHLLVFPFLFSKGFDLFTQIIHLPSFLFASCDNLVGKERLSLSYSLLSLFSTLLFGSDCPSPQPASWEELWHSSMAYFVFTGSSFLPSQGREELITNSFEISSLELWLPSN